VVGTHIGACSLLRLPIAMRATLRSHRDSGDDLFTDFHHGLLRLSIPQTLLLRADQVIE